jgi:hypothetical protein
MEKGEQFYKNLKTVSTKTNIWASGAPFSGA